MAAWKILLTSLHWMTASTSDQLFCPRRSLRSGSMDHNLLQLSSSMVGRQHDSTFELARELIRNSSRLRQLSVV